MTGIQDANRSKTCAAFPALPSITTGSVSRLIIAHRRQFPWLPCRCFKWGPNPFEPPVSLGVLFSILLFFGDQIIPPPRQMMKINWRAARTDRTSGISLVITCYVFGFPNAIAMKTKHIVAKFPAPCRRYAVEPFDTFLRCHPK